MKKKKNHNLYAVEMVVAHHGKFFVYAKNEADARVLVEKHCRAKYTRPNTQIPLDEVGWEFPTGYEKVIGSIALSENEVHLVRWLKRNGIVKSTRGKKWFAVETTFSYPKGRFCVNAKNEESARKLVEEKCGRQYPKMYSTLPKDVVHWYFPRKCEKTIGDVREVENW